MNIVIATGIYPPDIGGPAIYSAALRMSFGLKGHKVIVVFYTDNAQIKHKGKPWHSSYPADPVSRKKMLPLRYLDFVWKVFRCARGADVVYLQGPVSEGFPGTIGAMLARKPTVMKVVGDYAWEMYMQESGGDKMLLDEFIQADVGARRRRAHRKTIKIRLIERIERWTAKRAKQIIVPSEYLKTIVEQWGIPSEKIEVIYNAVDSISDFSVKTREEVRRGMGLDGKHVLSSVVRCIPWKRIDFIIRLLPKLPEDIHFVLAGDGPMLKNWKMLAEEIGVSSRIHFLGRVHQLKVFEICRAADLFVLPSGYEGFPHVIPEAAFEGLHSFVSDKGGNPEMLEILGSDFVTVLPYLDEKAWLDALQGEWPKRSAQNLPNVLTIQSMVDRTESLLKQCI
jgi:glycosyltransferase involved in cell wall biosynthesis